ncbi:MAG: methyltransferase domain-containing protein [Sphingomonadaceae bacterium]|nr:methyltransferase domain-containing protein [Sphingomonadaceae bacterium]
MATRPPPQIFSAPRLAAIRSRVRALQACDDAADFVLAEMVEDVLERLSFMRFAPQRALVLGDWSGRLAPALEQGGADVTALPAGAFDPQQPWPVEQFDFIACLSMLDTVNDLPGALIHMRNALSDGGLAIASFPGAGSLPRLRSAMLAADGDRPAARMHPMVDTRAAAELMQRAGFMRQVVDICPLNVSYRSLDRLVQDLREQGLSKALSSPTPPVTKAGLERARAAFLDGADSEGRVTERFELLTLTGWR